MIHKLLSAKVSCYLRAVHGLAPWLWVVCWVLGLPGICAAQFDPLPPSVQAVVIPEISLTAFEQPVPNYPAPQAGYMQLGPPQESWNYNSQPAPGYYNPPNGASNNSFDPTPFNPNEGLPENQPWNEEWLPEGLIYHPYLAGDREPGFHLVAGWLRGVGSVWDIALGGRMPIWRYGTQNGWLPEGWEVEIEGGVFPRLDPVGPSTPLIAMDFRFGVPLVYGAGPWQYKIGYYHLSSHLGDEYMLQHPEVQPLRINYVRDELLMGVSYYLLDDFRLYAELGVAAADGNGDVGFAKPFEFQFGGEYSSRRPNNFSGSPFAAVNSHLRQEVNFHGDFIAQVGWQWRGDRTGRTLRLGVEYFTGKSDYGEFYNQFEERLGFGIWYDY